MRFEPGSTKKCNEQELQSSRLVHYTMAPTLYIEDLNNGHSNNDIIQTVGQVPVRYSDIFYLNNGPVFFYVLYVFLTPPALPGVQSH